MKNPTLDQQFLAHLSSEQKGQVWSYYLLMTSPDMDPDQQIDQISQIWHQAENDQQLLEWLEFIDYFYTDVDEEELPTASKRAYLSEYLTEKVGLPPKDSETDGPIFLKCPRGKGYVVVLKDERASYDPVKFQQQRCKNCGYEYSQHTAINQEIFSAEA
jgi:hypothetical protein